MVIIGGLVFVFSTLGLWEIIRRRYSEIDLSFVPGIVVAAQTTILFGAGLLNILPEIACFLYAAGIICLAAVIIKDKNVAFIKYYTTPPFFFLFLSVILMSFFLRGKLFAHFDNFTHWALVVKRILETNRFPRNVDSIIIFQEYPLGSSVWIYFFSKLVGISESIQMLAQVYMIFAAILPLFSLCKNARPLALVIISSFTNYVLVYSVPATDLLVDTLLPLVAVSCLFYALSYCKKEQSTVHYLPAAFYLIQITQIKNSGLFFVAVISLLLVIFTAKSQKRWFRLLCIASPYLSFFLWHKHCQYVFDASGTSLHAMTAANYSEVFSSKSSEEIRLILSSIIKFLSEWKDIRLTFGLLVFALVCSWFISRQLGKTNIKMFLLSSLLFFLYQIGIFGMYVFSMQGSEAVGLSGIARYERTIIIAVLYLSAIIMLRTVSTKYSEKKIVSSVMAFLMASSFLIHMGAAQGKIRFALPDPDTTSLRIRNQVDAIRRDYHIPNGERYALLTSEADLGYTYYLCRYIFQSCSVDAKKITAIQDMDSIEADYILIFDPENEIIRSWIQENYPEQASAPVIITR